MFNIREVTQSLIHGSIIPAADGTNMYTPDGKGNYKAFWTRDFTYMVENSLELMPPEDVERGIAFLLSHAALDGWIPDRVEGSCTPKYTAGNGNFPATRNLDNGPFLCICADVYLRSLERTRALSLFAAWREGLCHALDCLPLAKSGLICNVEQPPHSPYGFTDTVAKTGLLSFETLLLWRALRAMSHWLRESESDSTRYDALVASIEANFEATFLGENGMLLAATECCRQTDVWASCFALSIGFPLSERAAERIRDWLIEHYDGIVCAGQIRHLPAGELWERTFIPVEGGVYQNGAFWATATGWFAEAIAPRDMALAKQTLLDALTYFENEGIFECINGDYRKLDTYVASACAVYGACKHLGLI